MSIVLTIYLSILFILSIYRSGEVTRNPSVAWEPRAASMKPYELDLTAAPHGMRIQLTPSAHGAVLKTTFPAFLPDEYVHVCFAEAQNMRETSVDGRSGITGEAHSVSQDRIPVINFGIKFVAVAKQASEIVNKDDMVCMRFKRTSLEEDKDPASSSQGGWVATVHIATSLINHDQALLNYNREVDASKFSFSDVHKSAKDIWNKMLLRAEVMEDHDTVSEDFTKKLTVFYTGLYRTLLFPRRLDEVNADGHVVHYSPYSHNGGVFKGPLCTDNGFWDTFRTVYPVLSLLYPDYLGDIVQGWINAYAEG